MLALNVRTYIMSTTTRTITNTRATTTSTSTATTLLLLLESLTKGVDSAPLLVLKVRLLFKDVHLYQKW